MKQPEYQGNGWALHNSDCIEGMYAMSESSIDCAIFSPPFGDLFVYSDSERDLGNAGSGEDFLAQYRYFADALARVMKPGRIVCVHCTDLPMRKGRDGAIGLQDFSGDLIRAHTEAGMIYHGRATIWKDPVVEMTRTKALGLLHKTICTDSAMTRVGMPDYMLFFRAPGDNPDRIDHTAYDRDSGKWKNGKPLEIAIKWLEHMHRIGMASAPPTPEQIELLMPHIIFDVLEWQKLASPVWMDINQTEVLNKSKKEKAATKALNDEKHVCPLQLDVIRRCLRLYSKPGDVIMDPFNGIGSTGYEAIKAYRRYIGFELKPEYAAQAGKNLAEAEASVGDLFGAVA